jgi:hypothetical protein
MSSKKKDDEKNNNSGISTGTIIGIITGVTVLALIAFVVYKYKYNSILDKEHGKGDIEYVNTHINAMRGRYYIKPKYL